jgi:hypothetical protein
MVDHLMIDEEDTKIFQVCSTPREAFEYLRDKLTEAFL